MQKPEITHLIFDWGDTLMRDNASDSRPMCQWENIIVVDHVPQMLVELPQSLVCIGASNASVSDAVLMRKAFELTGLAIHFQLFITSKELGVAKPDPLFFLKICELSKVHPSRCVHIGNDYVKDIKAAKEAGLWTVWFHEKQIPLPDDDYADIVIYSMKDLPRVLFEHFLIPSGVVPPPHS